MTFLLAMLVAVAAAVRSTWSPCGVSMLSTITPLTEATRGHRFSATAWWYVIGSLVGGVTLGALIALPALAIGTIGESSELLILAVVALVSVASDGRLAGFQLPGHDRQVNEHWLNRYRGWIYGAGFGWQIGFGLSTYIMTAGVYLLVVAGAVGGSAVNALLLGAVFGLIRGVGVFAASEIRDRESMANFHRRFETWRQPVRKAMIVVLGVVGTTAGIGSGGLLGLLVASVTVVATVAGVRTNRETSYRMRAVGTGST